MKHIILTAAALAVLASSANASDLKRAAEISVGQDRDKVLSVMGAPDDRQLNGNREALQYCDREGVSYNNFVVVWMLNGKVHGITNYNKLWRGKCDNQFKPVKWSEAPGAEKPAKGE